MLKATHGKIHAVMLARRTTVSFRILPFEPEEYNSTNDTNRILGCSGSRHGERKIKATTTIFVKVVLLGKIWRRKVAAWTASYLSSNYVYITAHFAESPCAVVHVYASVLKKRSNVDRNGYEE